MIKCIRIDIRKCMPLLLIARIDSRMAYTLGSLKLVNIETNLKETCGCDQ